MNKESEIIYLSLGTNLGDKIENLRHAIVSIEEKIGECLMISGIYESAAWGFESDDHFYNLVVEVRTTLTAVKVLAVCKEIETQLGRNKIDGARGYSSRVIDLDIIYFGQHVIHEEQLQVPHYQMQLRNFVLYPLSELAPQWIHPILKKTTAELLHECVDVLKVTRISDWK